MNIKETVVSSQDKEIDLIEIVKMLWNNKKIIFLSAFLFTLIASIYAFTAKERWTSKAEVLAPKLVNLGDYYTVRKEYARILNGEFDPTALSGGLYGKFNLYTESLDKREEFFKKSSVYQSMIDGKSELEQRQILSDLINEDIIIVKPDAKKEPDLIGRRISFSAETAEVAQNTLRDFISFNSRLAYQEDIDNFIIGFNEVLKDLNYEKSKFERDLKIQKSVQLENLNKALNIAKEAGIVEYLKSFDSTSEMIQSMAFSDTRVPLSDSKLSDGTYLFMLGEKYLKAQIGVVSKLDIVYPPRYYVVTELLNELEPLFEKTKNMKVQSFYYLASPDKPIKRDWPRRAILLIVGLFFGGIVGVTIVILRQIFRSRKV